MTVQRFGAQIETFILKSFRRDLFTEYIPYSIANEDNLVFLNFFTSILKEELLKNKYNPKLRIDSYYDKEDYDFKIKIPIDDFSKAEIFHNIVDKNSNKIFFFVREIKDKKIKNIEGILEEELIKFYKIFSEQKALKRKISRNNPSVETNIKKRL